MFDPDKLVLPPYFVDTEETRKQLVNYYAEVQDLDQSVGKVITLLDQLEMRENTLLIFVSEQGMAMPFAKWTCYESGLQSAFPRPLARKDFTRKCFRCDDRVCRYPADLY